MRTLFSKFHGFVLIAAMTFGTSAFAGYTGSASQQHLSSVKSVLAKPVDDQFVALKGHLLKQLSSDKYLFSDGTGEIRVEIDNDLFPSQPINDKTLIEIRGEVEKDFMESPEIDVDRLIILTP